MKLEIDVKLPRRDFLMEISLSITAGLSGIYGPSGSGKSSLLHLIAGVEKPSTGKITFNDKVLLNTSDKTFVSPRERGIGMVFQEALLFPTMNVKKNLLFASRFNKNRPQLIGLDEVVEILELEKLLNSHPGNISGGEAQRVAIGRALLSSPEILLLDEPFSAVDSRLRNEIIPFIEKLHHRLNIPMLIISHDLPDLLKLTDKLILLCDGKVIGNGPFVELQKEFHLLPENF